VALLDKIVYAGTMSRSFEQASKDLRKLAEVDVPTKQVERVCQRIGDERVRQRNEAVSAYQELPLAERKAVPPGVRAPEVAMVGCDGGRLQILPRGGGAVEAEAADVAAEGRRGKHWREDKIGVLQTMQSTVSASDPCPEIPDGFVDPRRIVQLARELKKPSAAREEAAQETSQAELDAETLAENPVVYEAPEVVEKCLVGSRVRWPDFGPILATLAWQQGFFGASRQAFVGDGSDNNWTIWRHYFSSFVPILDFIHALSYVFAAAMAGRNFAEGWSIYAPWIRWVWQGEVAAVIAALAQRQRELGAPQEADGDTSPRQIVAQALTYLQNHQSQMKYAEYRQQGLPITSSYVESAVKQFNQRVKGTEKFWSEEGAEAILQLRADHLSAEEPLAEFWQTRQAQQTGRRPYRKAA